MKIRLILLFIGLSLQASAQLFNIPYNRDRYLKLESGISKDVENIHTSIKPFIYEDLKPLLEKDTSVKFQGAEKSNAFITPILDLTYSGEIKDKYALFSAWYGARAGISLFKNKLSAEAGYFAGNAENTPWRSSFIRNYGSVPGIGKAHETQAGYASGQLMFNVAYRASKYFTVSAGRNKFFLGDGYRSLLLSDFAPSFPHLALRTKIWKLSYLNVFGLMNDISVRSSSSPVQAKKFTAIHYLSWNIHKNFNLSFFEAEIYQTRDSAALLGIEPNYFNPVIFYRPVEYSIGSSDNALLGMSMKLRVLKKNQLYGQLLLDEFSLTEIRKRSGWWANKYSIQAGFKSFDLFRIKGLYLQGEINYIRPFTYSHGNPTQSYSHMNQSLAHPLGSNLEEAVGIIAYTKGKWLFEIRGIISDYGTDIGGQNFGSDILKSYKTREKEYGNFTGQGQANRSVYNLNKVAYLIKRWGIQAEVGSELRMFEGAVSQKNLFLFAGIRSNLFNSYREL